ncbi:MAG: PAS domain-containing protein [Pseudomonadota bacterium]
MDQSFSPAAQALQDRESQLAEVQRIAGVGGVVVDLREGFQNHRSPEYLVIHGLPPEAANETHEDWVRRLHPDDRERTEKQFLEAVRGSALRYSSEYRIIRPSDGEVRWIAAEARIDRREDGRPIRLIGAHIDITERVLAKGMLRESEDRFRLIADSAPVPMWVTQLDRTRAFANRAYVEFLGLPYDKALTFDWRTIIHPDDLSRIIQESLDGEASLQPFVLEGRYRRADGQWRWMLSESQPRWDPTGMHVGFIGVAHDVTTAKQAEIELRQLNETLEGRIRERTAQLRSNGAQLRAILETSNQYQALLDLKGRLIYVNAIALADIRTEKDTLTGTYFWNGPWFSGSAEIGETIHAAFKKALAGETAKVELALDLPVGRRHLDFAMRPVRDEGGRLNGILSEAVDTTELRQNEEALRQAQKMEAVGQLTGGVAHDFNNLLTIIRSAVDFLRRRDLPIDRRNRYVDAIADTVDRASKLTSQLLAFARRQPLAPQAFNVGYQVESVTNMIRPLVGSRIQVDLDLGERNIFAVADIVQFETALVNLAVNARDAMNGEGMLRITVAAASEIPALRNQSSRRGQFVAISVMDHGSGIPEESLDAIFEPFYTTKEIGKGTGLGLSQAIGFAKQSGGEIRVTSEIRSGSTFTIYLPQAQAPGGQTSSAESTQDVYGGKGQRILLVEDNPEVGEFTQELLQDLGYAVKWVKSGNEALTLIEEDEFAFDLIFSDVMMPGINGVELAERISEGYPGLPVLLTSGYSTVLTESTPSGVELIKKPYSVEVLARALRKATSASAK